MDVRQRELFEIATAASLGPRAFNTPGGGLIVTQRGARVLGIYVDGVPDNLVWVNPDGLPDPVRAARFVAEAGWNVGGDRAWLSPEIELHFLDPDHPTHENYAVPPGIDPGEYVVQFEAEYGIALASSGEAHNLYSERPFQFQIQRTIQLVAPPVDVQGVGYVGYEISSRLRVTSADRPNAEYGLWHLMQLPAGGVVYIPTKRTPEQVDYFGTGIERHCRATERHIEFPVTGLGKQKLGLRAADVWGIMGYYREVGGGSAVLTVRQAAVFPGAVYADYPSDARGRRDVAFQFYNDNASATGQPTFGEMEYHAPAARSDNFFHVRDVSRTWCFGGPAERVRQVSRELLGVEQQ